MTVVRYDPKGIDDETLRALYQIHVVEEAENYPGVPPVSFRQWAVWERASVRASALITRYLAEENGSVVGSAKMMRWPVDDPDNGFVLMAVLPDHRRRGIGRSMLKAALDDLEEAEVRRLIVDCPAGRPWESALGRLGLSHVFTEKMSRLSLENLDLELMDLWIDRATERAADYDLLFLEDPIADEYIEQWCRVRNVLSTAPREDLEMADHLVTPEEWRQREQSTRDREDRHVAFVAVHRDSGDFTGYTDVQISAYDRSRIYQVGTAVDPVHRDRGLGRWVKASMAKWIVENYPEANWVDTGNAGSNAAMLGINIEMGFETVLDVHAWQGDIAAVRSKLA